MEFDMNRFVIAFIFLVGCERAETNEVVEGLIEDASESGLVQDNPDLVVSISEDYSWEEGYCSLVTVTNAGEQEVDWEVRIKVGGQVSSYWNAEMQRETHEAVQFHGTATNFILPVADSVEFGFCVDL